MIDNEKIPAAKKPKPTRSPEDPCLLCKVRPATKEQSHIITKFWVNTMRGDDAFYKLNTFKKHLAEKAQDSPKEDFIFCPECEARFSYVERYMANNFYNKLHDSSYASDFKFQRNWNLVTKELDWLIPLNVNPGLFKLLIYSFVWRISISKLEDFASFSLSPEVEEKLRYVLDTFMQSSEKENAPYYDAHREKFIHFPFNIITTYSPMSKTSNMLAAFDTQDDKIGLFVNEFIIMFHHRWHPKQFFDGAWNAADKPINICLIDEKEWKRTYDGLAHFLARTRHENVKAGRTK
jgi:hypothetical protein